MAKKKEWRRSCGRNDLGVVLSMSKRCRSIILGICGPRAGEPSRDKFHSPTKKPETVKPLGLSEVWYDWLGTSLCGVFIAIGALAAALGAALSFAFFSAFLMCGFELVFGQLPVVIGIDFVEVLDEAFRTSAFKLFQ